MQNHTRLKSFLVFFPVFFFSAKLSPHLPFPLAELKVEQTHKVVKEEIKQTILPLFGNKNSHFFFSLWQQNKSIFLIWAVFRKRINRKKVSFYGRLSFLFWNNFFP